MESFHFEIEDVPEHIHGLDLGHITVRAPGGEITSRGRVPDQAMMLFPSISNLLDGVAGVASGKKGATFRFSATDSSFSIVFAHEKGGNVSLTRDRKSFGTVPARELVEALWAGVTALLQADGARFDRQADASCKAAFGDLDAAIERFARSFNLPLPR